MSKSSESEESVGDVLAGESCPRCLESCGSRVKSRCGEVMSSAILSTTTERYLRSASRVMGLLPYKISCSRWLLIKKRASLGPKIRSRRYSLIARWLKGSADGSKDRSSTCSRNILASFFTSRSDAGSLSRVSITNFSRLKTLTHP